MTVRAVIPDNRGWDVKILATDIDSNVLARAETGIYPNERAEHVPQEYLRRFCRKGVESSAGSFRINDEVRDLICFRRLNLMEAWPMRGPFDVIFCRNVVIYFAKDTQRELIARYADLLGGAGHLFIGHSETLFKVSDRFELVGRTIYRKL
jgi:chemotaxis protein methyltransferase CheR